MKKESYEKQVANIVAFSKLLTRERLEFGLIERKLHLHTTQAGERIYIQYPGKESARAEPRWRPWDFRPKLMLPDDTFLQDLSFPNIWDDLHAMQAQSEEVLAVLATVFFRMALMLDHHFISDDYKYVDIMINENMQGLNGKVKLPYYKLQIPADTLEYLHKKIGKIRNVSLEGYLIYNDLLAQNDDCKYYYQDVVINKKDWVQTKGRYNNLLSHISVIEYLEGIITFSGIMSRFQRGMGVAPLTIARIRRLSRGLIQ